MKCDICLRTRKLGDHMGSLKVFGSLTACERCIYAAVHWAHTCACKWGGAYGDEQPAKTTADSQANAREKLT